MTLHDDLGLRPIINAAAALTALGGALMPPEVLAAMVEAAGAPVDMLELHSAVGKRLATLTDNEAAYVTPGCAAAIVLAILGIRTGGDPARLTKLRGHSQAPDEVVMHLTHRIPYDAAVALAGAKVRQFGNAQQSLAWQLESVITERTAAVLYVAGDHLASVALPLEQVVEIAHAHGVPVIVDAASQLPPVENLWRFTRDQGADLAMFSGGKALRGPQASGLMVGRAELIDAARNSGAPHQRWGRALKAGKEEIAGLLAAVTRYMSLDHAQIGRDWLGIVEGWASTLSRQSGVVVWIDPRNEAGQPVPRLHVSIDEPRHAQAVIDSLARGTPSVVVLPDVAGGRIRGFWMSPDVLQEGEERVVAEAVVDALASISRITHGSAENGS